MAYFEINDGTLTTKRFGDRVQIPIPTGGRVELLPNQDHVDVEVRESRGTVFRKFRLPNGVDE